MHDVSERQSLWTEKEYLSTQAEAGRLYARVERDRESKLRILQFVSEVSLGESNNMRNHCCEATERYYCVIKNAWLVPARHSRGFHRFLWIPTYVCVFTCTQVAQFWLFSCQWTFPVSETWVSPARKADWLKHSKKDTGIELHVSWSLNALQIACSNQ